MNAANSRLDPSRRDLLAAGLAAGSGLALLARSAARAAGEDKVIHGHKEGVVAVAVTADGKTLITASYDGTVKLWTMPDGRLIGTQQGQAGYLRAVAPGRGGAMLASGGGSKWIKLWELEKEDEEKEALVFKGAEDELIYALASTPDDRILISGGSLGTIQLWNWADGGRLGDPLKGHTGPIHALAVSADSQLLASGGHDKAIRVWSLPGGQERMALAGHPRAISSLAITPDRKHLVSGAMDGAIWIWSLRTGKLLRKLKDPHTAKVTSLVIARSGALLISASLDRTIKLWNLDDGEPLGTLGEHSRPVLSLAVSPDEQTVITGDEDGVVRLWSPASRRVQGFLFDEQASGNDAVLYERKDPASGRVLLYAFPLGYLGPRVLGVVLVEKEKVKGCNKSKAAPPGGSKGPPNIGQARFGLALGKLPPAAPKGVPLVRPRPWVMPKPAIYRPSPRPIPGRPPRIPPKPHKKK